MGKNLTVTLDPGILSEAVSEAESEHYTKDSTVAKPASMEEIDSYLKEYYPDLEYNRWDLVSGLRELSRERTGVKLFRRNGKYYAMIRGSCRTKDWLNPPGYRPEYTTGFWKTHPEGKWATK